MTFLRRAQITPWFTSSITTGGVTNPGYFKVTHNDYTDIVQPLVSGQPIPYEDYVSNGILGGYFGGQGREGWADVTDYYEATPVNRNNVPNPATPSGLPIYATASQQWFGLIPAMYGQEGAYLAQGPFGNSAIEPYGGYAAFVGTTTGAYPGVPVGSPIPGGGYYNDKTLTDPSIFNFYKLLLDRGPNKSEWKKWEAFNITVDQTFFDDRPEVSRRLMSLGSKNTRKAQCPFSRVRSMRSTSTSARPIPMARRIQTWDAPTWRRERASKSTTRRP